MQQLPVLAHVQVVAHSGGKIGPGASTETGEETPGVDFAAVLANRIDAQDGALAGAIELPVKEPFPPQSSPAAMPPADDAAAISSMPPPASLVATADAVLAQMGSQRDAIVTAAPDIPTPHPVNTSLFGGDDTGKAPLRFGVERALSPSGDPGLPIAAAKSAGVPATLAAPEEAAQPVFAPHTTATSVESVQSPPSPAPLPAPVAPGMAAGARHDAAQIHTQDPARVEIPFGTRGWDQAFAQRVSWVVTNQQQVAQLQLNPPNLGPVEIRISVSNDQASALFVSPHASVRDAIESALPRLREMLAESGLTLGNVDVSSQSFQQQAHSQTPGAPGYRATSPMPAAVASPTVPVPPGFAGVGLVDTFA